ncbi:MAG: sigma-54-dependent transcriptional regulator [Lacipirellulaceae bacterium]
MKTDHQEIRSPRVLVVDDHATARQSVVDVLGHCGYAATPASSGAEALAALAAAQFDVVVTDLQMPGMSGLELIREIERRRFPTQVLMVTAHASIGTAVEAMRLGAFDYLEKPYDADRLERSVARAVARGSIHAGENPLDADPLAATPLLVGSSPAMMRLRAEIARVAVTDETVLLCGESGVGKELVAQTLHGASRRAAAPLVSLNCPVLSEQLTESELFGHVRGAFTGADADRIGRFEMAHGGSLLLDEVTEVNLGLQAKLLRVLQERTFERVGSSESRKVDARVLATTNRDLAAEIAAGRFREDLYYRLAVLPVHVPPLREREGDVLVLADHFLRGAAARLDRPAITLTAGARELLAAYNWPGNVRELHNVVTRACVLSPSDAIAADLVGPWLQSSKGKSFAPAVVPTPAPALEPVVSELAGGMRLEEVERQVILATLRKHDGHRVRTAEALGIGVRTLSGKLRIYGVAPRDKGTAAAA